MTEQDLSSLSKQPEQGDLKMDRACAEAAMLTNQMEGLGRKISWVDTVLCCVRSTILRTSIKPEKIPQ